MGGRRGGSFAHCFLIGQVVLATVPGGLLGLGKQWSPYRQRLRYWQEYLPVDYPEPGLQFGDRSLADLAPRV